MAGKATGKWLTLAFLALLIFAALTAHAGAQDITEKIVWDGDHPIKDSLATKTASEAALTRANAVYTELEKLELPYKFSDGKTTIVIKKIAFDEKRRVYGVWIEATRDGKEVYTRSPVWVHGSPVVVETSRVSTSAEAVTVTLKEDPLAAFQRVMLDYTNGQPLGKAEGDDTLIAYSNNDASLAESNVNSWAGLRAAGGNSVSKDQSTQYPCRVRATTTADQYNLFYRYIVTFNTSTIGSGSTITSANITIQYSSKNDGLGTTNLGIGITGCSPADKTSIVAGDYDSFSDTELSDRVSYADWGATEIFTLNAAGLSYITKDGFTAFMLRDSWDITNNYEGAWASGASTFMRLKGHGDATESNRPKLTVVYTPGGGSAPVAAFSANVTTGYPPFAVLFTDSSTNTPTDWDWYFGDESKDSDSQNPTWTVNNVIGNSVTQYAIKLLAGNAYGSDWENKTDYITAYPLNASFTLNTTSGCAPLHVGFTDATNNGTPSSWSWLFGGDGNSSDQNPTHVFNTPGTYWVQLNASNAYSWDIENKTSLITVNAATVAAFSANQTVGCPPLHVGFTDASTGTGLSNWSWDFDDDDVPDSYDRNATWTFSDAGTYTVNLTVVGDCGTDSEIKTDYITVSSGTVSADFSADDTTPTVGQTVTFTDLSTGGPTSWNWSFGDGNFSETQNPTHAYGGIGVFTVNLTAVNGCGGSDTESKTDYINVSAAATPTPTPTPTGTIPSGNVTEGNITYIYAPDQDYVPFPIWLAIVIVSIALFGHSIIFLRNSDLTAMMAAVFAFISAWLSNMIGYIDVQVTYIAEEILISPVIQAVHPPWLVYTMLLFALVSVVNIFAAIYKVYLKPTPWNEIYNRKLPKWRNR